MENRGPARVPQKNHKPKWKDKLRENCLKRVQRDREMLLWKFRQSEKGTVRSAVREIVCDEIKKIRKPCSSKPYEISAACSDDPLWERDGLSTTFEPNGEEYIELMIEMENLLHKDIAADIIKRDKALLEDYERTLDEEDDYLAQAVLDHMELNKEKDDGIWCPICKSGSLRENQHIVYCPACNLQLNLQSDKVSLDFVRDRLGEVIDEHLAGGCRAKPKFCMENKFGFLALYIKCQYCAMFDIVV